MDFAPVTDPFLLPQLIAEVLGIREHPDQPLSRTLGAALEEKHLCLLLDNCEHLITACATLIESLLHTCPRLTILATSREALRLPGEVTWRVPSLAVPPGHPSFTLTAVRTYASVQLFVARAQAADPQFTLTEQDLPAIITICRSLDGIPLALELAAARLPMFSVDELATRLHDRFQLFTQGSRTALPRHQTLRACLDWSYALLTPAERAVLGRLAVFAGSWMLAAAETICVGAETPPEALLDVIGNLVDKSLVVVEEHGRQRRYRLLETIRHYAREKLDEAGESASVYQRHAVWYLRLAEEAEAALWGPEQVAWLNRLTAELDNLRAALAWFGADDREQGLRLMSSLCLFLHLRGYQTEGRQWLEETLAALPPITPAIRVKALACASALAWAQDDHAQAQALSREGLALAAQAAEIPLQVLTLLRLRQIEAAGDDGTPRDEVMRAWLQEARQVDDHISLLLLLLKATEYMIDLGDRPRATHLAEQALEQARRVGGPWCIAVSVLYQGRIALQDGDLREARARYEASLAIQRAMQNRTGEATVLRDLALIAQAQGQLGEAVALLQQSLTLYRNAGEQRQANACLALLAPLTAGER